MPELPEVETIVQELRQSAIIGKKITDVQLFWKKTAHSVKDFVKELKGETLLAIDRRAKFIILRFSNQKTVLVHLRMTGRIHVGETNLDHERLRLSFGGTVLHYIDTRKFGRWYLLDNPDAILKNLGPEPLSDTFTPAVLKQILQSHSRQLKSLLLDQKCIAGLGNIYVDEALWRAKLHPKRSSASVTDAECYELHAAIRYVLERGIRLQGASLGAGITNYSRPDGSRGKHQNEFDVFRKTKMPCPRCHSPIIRIIVSQRGTHICPKCQTL